MLVSCLSDDFLHGYRMRGQEDGGRTLQRKGAGDCIHSTTFSLWHSNQSSVSDFYLLMQTEETNCEMSVVELCAVLKNPKVKKMVSGSLKNRTGAEDERGRTD